MLTDKRQEAIEFLYARGLSIPKVADALEMHENTVFRRLSGITELLREEYQEQVIAEALRMVKS